MTIPRSSGVLLHPTSLPGPYGIGELGESAHAFVDWLARAGQHWWQVMPLGPTGYGDSPYQSFSAFAGNPYLISLDALIDLGLLSAGDLQPLPEFNPQRVDFGLQYFWRRAVLARAYEAFAAGKVPALTTELKVFREQERDWLADYALFTALKSAHDGRPWNEWEPDIRARQPEAIARWRDLLARDIERTEFEQLLFFKQWRALRDYARGRGVQVIGDIPIFVAMDSADAWAHPEQFYFDEAGQPTVVAGVPPDYFSETGQLWGNPLYRWDVMQADHFRWWTQRVRGNLKLYDLIRLDHFRGLAAYWEIPYPAETAMVGEWVPAPGRELLQALETALGDIPIIAEDLGVVTPDVEALRDDFNLPGMAVLQFAFGGGDFSVNAFLPHNIPENRVVYTGTHDNDTTRGWWVNATEEEKHTFRVYTSSDPTEETFAPMLTEIAFQTGAVLAVVPLQDLMNLGSEDRMNLPGSLGDHNWTWRYLPEQLTSEMADHLRDLTERTGRRVE